MKFSSIQFKRLLLTYSLNITIAYYKADTNAKQCGRQNFTTTLNCAIVSADKHGLYSRNMC
jgi:hypothetical protein